MCRVCSTADCRERMLGCRGTHAGREDQLAGDAQKKKPESAHANRRGVKYNCCIDPTVSGATPARFINHPDLSLCLSLSRPLRHLSLSRARSLSLSRALSLFLSLSLSRSLSGPDESTVVRGSLAAPQGGGTEVCGLLSWTHQPPTPDGLMGALYPRDVGWVRPTLQDSVYPREVPKAQRFEGCWVWGVCHLEAPGRTWGDTGKP